jgi:hypothetical protein
MAIRCHAMGVFVVSGTISSQPALRLWPTALVMV